MGLGLDMCDKEKFELDRDEDPMSFSTSIPLDWRYEGGAANNLANTSGGLVGSSYVPNFWDHPMNSQNMGLCDINGSSSSNSIGNNRKDGLPFSRAVHDNRTLEIMGWNNPSISSVLKGGGFLPQSLSQIPTDSGFIERAARFSCFSGGNFGDMVNSFGVPQSMGLYDRRNGLGGQAQENPLNVGEATAKDVSVSPISVQNLATNKGSSPIRNDRRSESLVTSQDEEAKQALGRSVNNGSDRAESSGDDGACGQDDAPMLEDTSGEPLNKGINSKKRKRNVQDGDNEKAGRAPEIPNETAIMEDSDSRQKGGQQPNSTIKNSGKNVKQSSQASDPPKEEYIHVRARRGQATNSHSLAERVRREKISERMKFLQDLVPGCSKVTGKAVMLDEIINYVQSLQRQVEFLSMKLATVNSRLDFNLEGLIAKDILQQRPGPSSLLGFPPEMPMAFPSLHPSQPGFLQSSLHGITNSSDIIRRTIHSQLAPVTGGFKDSSHQLPDMWEDELHNIVQMNFPTTTAPLSSAEGNAAQPEGQMKVEL